MTLARISILLGGLTLAAALASSCGTDERARAEPLRLAPAPTRVRHVLVEEGCFVPPPEPVEVPPCDARR